MGTEIITDTETTEPITETEPIQTTSEQIFESTREIEATTEMGTEIITDTEPIQATTEAIYESTSEIPTEQTKEIERTETTTSVVPFVTKCPFEFSICQNGECLILNGFELQCRCNQGYSGLQIFK
jgi:hypothetical protein